MMPPAHPSQFMPPQGQLFIPKLHKQSVSKPIDTTPPASNNIKNLFFQQLNDIQIDVE